MMMMELRQYSHPLALWDSREVGEIMCKMEDYVQDGNIDVIKCTVMS
jgi:hypothetical protein